jgi:hypothetical protein
VLPARKYGNFSFMVLRFLKQKLDRWAINLAAKALPPGRQNPARLHEAKQLLASTQLLEFPDVRAELVQSENHSFHFESSLPLGFPRNDRVHGKLFRTSTEWKSKPLVLLVHGWNAELHYLYILPRLARALNQRGINAALIELPLHLQRRPPRTVPGPHDFISDDLVTMLRATQQALADFHALAKWARAQGCPNIALWGFSLGAWLAGLCVCGSEAPSHAILTTPIIDLARAVRELPFCHPVRSALAGENLDLAKLNLTAHRPKIPPRQIHVCQCDYDVFVPIETFNQLASAWRLPRVHTCAQSHLSVLLSPRSMRVSIDWLAQQFARAAIPSRPPAAASAAPV